MFTMITYIIDAGNCLYNQFAKTSWLSNMNKDPNINQSHLDVNINSDVGVVSFRHKYRSYPSSYSPRSGSCYSIGNSFASSSSSDSVSGPASKSSVASGGAVSGSSGSSSSD